MTFSQPDALDVNCVFKKNEHVVSREIVGETILVPVSGRLADMQAVFAVEAAAAFIWDHIDGARTVREIGDLVSDHFDVGPDDAKADLVDFLSELYESGLIMRNRSQDKQPE